VFQIFFLVLALTYLGWLMYLAIRLVCVMRELPILSVRIKFFVVFSLIVMLMASSGVAINWYGPASLSTTTFLSFLALFNFYPAIMALLYMPSSESTGTLLERH